MLLLLAENFVLLRFNEIRSSTLDLFLQYNATLLMLKAVLESCNGENEGFFFHFFVMLLDGMQKKLTSGGIVYQIP